jgi:hypothetical protein
LAILKNTVHQRASIYSIFSTFPKIKFIDIELLTLIIV